MRGDAVLNNISDADQDYYAWSQDNLGQDLNNLMQELEILQRCKNDFSQYFAQPNINPETLKPMYLHFKEKEGYCLRINMYGFIDIYAINGELINNPLELIKKGVDFSNEEYESLENALMQLNYEKKLYDKNMSCLNTLIQGYEDQMHQINVMQRNNGN